MSDKPHSPIKAPVPWVERVLEDADALRKRGINVTEEDFERIKDSYRPAPPAKSPER